MAFSRRAFYGEQQVKSFSDMPIEVTASLGGIVITGSLDQTDHQVINGSQVTPRSTNRHSGSIFVESDVTAIVQASFNQPMFAPG